MREKRESRDKREENNRGKVVVEVKVQEGEYLCAR